jgi:hypothetical protein
MKSRRVQNREPCATGLNSSYIQNAVVSQLTGKGLTQTQADNADLYVGYQVAVDQEKQWNAFGMGRFGGMGSATSSTIKTGMFRPGSLEPVDPIQTAIEAGKAIRAAALMARFPSIATPDETDAIDNLAEGGLRVCATKACFPAPLPARSSVHPHRAGTALEPTFKCGIKV